MDKLDDGIPLGGASQTIGGNKRRWRPPERHRWFDPWKIAKGDNLKTEDKLGAPVGRNGDLTT
jgi:hypothetical protein